MSHPFLNKKNKYIKPKQVILYLSLLPWNSLVHQNKSLINGRIAEDKRICIFWKHILKYRINEIFFKIIQTHNCKRHLHHDISANAYFFKCIIMSLWEFIRNLH